MRFLHTGDLHLDSAFSSLGVKDAAARREEGRDLLRRIFDCAEQEKCEMILMAGDIFDSKFVSAQTEELLYSLIEQCHIPVVISPGNHDPYVEGGIYSKLSARLGESALIFSSPELQYFDIDTLGVRVFGYAFTSAAMTASPLSASGLPEENNYIKIFCGHADLASPISRYAPVTVEELTRFGFAYSALGHIHSEAITDEYGEKVRYCGFAEGRSFDELGEGGVWIVDISDEESVCTRKILSKRGFYLAQAEVNVEDTPETLRENISALAHSVCLSEENHLRVRLVGTADDRFIKDVYAQSEQMRTSCGLAELEIIDETMPLFDGEYLRRDTTIRGELYRVLLPMLSSADDGERRKALRALRIGLAAIDGKDIHPGAE